MSQLLSLFLRFLYGDHIGKTTLSNEQLIELLIMADRFEVEQLSSGLKISSEVKFLGLSFCG